MSNPQVKSGLAQSTTLHLILIALLGLLAYSNTFDVPFQYDGTVNIVDNPLVKDLRYYTDLSGV